MRYFLEIVEDADRIPTGRAQGYETEAEAIEAAKGRVDDALPRNYVRVFCLVGSAHLDGDGGTSFRPVTS